MVTRDRKINLLYLEIYFLKTRHGSENDFHCAPRQRPSQAKTKSSQFYGGKLASLLRNMMNSKSNKDSSLREGGSVVGEVNEA